jgi:tetratricopeptide (TPR) repeat protein
MAEYFGSCEIATTKGKLSLTPGRVLEDAVLTVQQAISSKESIPLQKLLATARDDFDGVHYAHAWSFVYFLQNNAKYTKSFNKFFKDLYGLDLKEAKPELLDAGDDDKSGLRRRYKADDIRAAMLARLGTKDVAALEKEWLAFVTAIPIDAPRARFLRGYENALYGEDPKKGLADLDAAIEGGYHDAQAYWARGTAKLFAVGQEAALLDFRRAVEIDPLDPVYRADLAWGLVLWWGGDSEKMLGTEEERDEAQMQFALAADLDPENDYLRTLYDEFVEARKTK